MKRSLFILFIFPFIWTSSTWAQKPIWKDIFLDEEINLFSLQTDTLGFVWGLSKNGLFQYDGFNMIQRVFSENSNTHFTSICVDHRYNYLIGTSAGELIQYNPYSNKIINRFLKKMLSPITFMDCEDVEANCLIISYGNGIIWSVDGQDTVLNIENILISNEVYSGFIKEKKVILATDQGIQSITKKEGKLVSKVIDKSDGLGDIIISNIIEHDGTIYASDYDSQIYQIEMSDLSITTFDLPVKSRINGIKMVSGGQLVIFCSTGIYALEDDHWIKKYPDTGSREVLDIAIDEENNLWAISLGNKLSKASLYFEFIPSSVEKSQSILKIDDQFWIGSSEGLFVVEGLKKTKVLDNNITCLKMIDDNILIGTYSSGVLVLDRKGLIIGAFDGWANNPKQSVLYIYPDQNFVYISSLTGVIKMKFVKNNGQYIASEIQTLNEQIGPGYIYQIIENQGSLYFATDRQGLKILRKDTLQHFTHLDNGNALGSIYSMTIGENNRLYFSSSTGDVGFEENGKVFSINNERYLQDPYTSLITSSDQKIVMIRNSSIDIYDAQSGHYLYYSDGELSDNQELYLNSYTQSSSSIYLAKPDGILRISGLQDQKVQLECIINQVIVNLVDIGTENVFAENQNNLEFNYSSAWMTDPERVTYQYKLEGFDDVWRDTRDRRSVYPMLRPGKYIFRVKASADGIFTHDQATSFPFTINRVFYKRWWFIALVILMIGGIVYYWRNEKEKIRLHREDLIKKRTEAQLLSLQTQLNPHFLFNSFNTLIGLMEETPSKGIKFTEKLSDFYRSILIIGKKDLIPLQDEIQLLSTYIHLLKERFGEQLSITIQLDDINAYIIPPLTLQLLIENAVKHNVVSTKRPLHITLKQEENCITVRNKKVPKLVDAKGTGSGLENITKRHSLNNLKPPKVEQNDKFFMVTIYLNKIEE